MLKPRSGVQIRAPLWLALLALPGALHGCSSPTEPKPPGGGQAIVYSFPEFAANVEPVLMRHGCDATGDCHGGGIRGTYELSPPNAKDAQFDFNQSILQLSPTNPASSRLLTQPLATSAGGTPHPFKPFASTADSDYQAIAQWVSHGVPQ